MKSVKGRNIENRKIKEQIQKIVIARLETIPKDIEISVGTTQYTREELSNFVREGNEIGNQLMKSQIEYLRDLSSGKIYGLIDEQNNSYYTAKP